MIETELKMIETELKPFELKKDEISIEQNCLM